MTTEYGNILDALHALPWHEPEKLGVTKIAPVGHESSSFFPGQCGFQGARFPVRGIMLVANNFDNLDGWKRYRDDLSEEDNSTTMVKFRDYVLPETREPLEHFWFTNYCLGVMNRKTSQYKFPSKAVETLKFREFFEKSVEYMKPRVIVTMGAYAAEWLGTDYSKRERVDTKTFGDHSSRLLAIVHPSAWTWNGIGFSKDDFRNEGKRICRALGPS